MATALALVYRLPPSPKGSELSIIGTRGSLHRPTTLVRFPSNGRPALRCQVRRVAGAQSRPPARPGSTAYCRSECQGYGGGGATDSYASVAGAVSEGVAALPPTEPIAPTA